MAVFAILRHFVHACKVVRQFPSTSETLKQLPRPSKAIYVNPALQLIERLETEAWFSSTRCKNANLRKRKFCVFGQRRYRYCPDVWTPFKYQRDPASRPTNSVGGIAICISSVRATQPLPVITIHQTRFENATVANSSTVGTLMHSGRS